MHLVYSILLYLHAACPCTYTQAQMDGIVTAYQPVIYDIEADPILSAQIEQEYGDEANQIVVVDWEEK